MAQRVCFGRALSAWGRGQSRRRQNHSDGQRSGLQSMTMDERWSICNASSGRLVSKWALRSSLPRRVIQSVSPSTTASVAVLAKDNSAVTVVGSDAGSGPGPAASTAKGGLTTSGDEFKHDRLFCPVLVQGVSLFGPSDKAPPVLHHP